LKRSPEAKVTCEDGIFEYKDLVNFLDAIAPWGKQHVFLYNGPESEIEKWRREEYCINMLKENGLLEYLNSYFPLILPINYSIINRIY